MLQQATTTLLRAMSDGDHDGAPEICLDARPAASSSSSSLSRVKPIPLSFRCDTSLTFSYEPSGDGVDTNLLILLHGRGDNEQPFAKLAKSLQLPQTATLAIRGPRTVPLLDDHEREWWEETDYMGMGEVFDVKIPVQCDVNADWNITPSSADVPNPDPSAAVKLMVSILTELTTAVQSSGKTASSTWRMSDIHLFGFAQGGSLAIEVGRAIHRRTFSAIPGEEGTTLGSIISIQGSPMTLPTSGTSPTSTPILYVSRPAANQAKAHADLASLRRAYKKVTDIALSRKEGDALSMLGMPRDRGEWQPVMYFWSEKLKRKSAWELDGDLLEVTRGASNVPSISPLVNAPRYGQDKVSSHGRTADPDAPNPASAESSASIPSAQTVPVKGLKRGFLSKGLA